MENKNSVATFIAIIEFIIIVVLLMDRASIFNFKFDFNTKEMKLVDSYENIDTEIKNINFNLYSTDVEIKESENNLKVEYYSTEENNDKIKIEENSIILKEEANTVVCFGICNNRRKIVIYVPKENTSSYNIVTASGDIKSFINLNENLVDIKTTSGDISLENVTSANLTTTSGDILIKDANTLNIQTTSGEVKISKVSDNFNINSTSGDIKIVNLEIKSNSNINTTSGDVIIENNSSDCYIDYNTRSGDEYIEKNNRKSDVILNIKTTSGDIKVK